MTIAPKELSPYSHCVATASDDSIIVIVTIIIIGIIIIMCHSTAVQSLELLTHPMVGSKSQIKREKEKRNQRAIEKRRLSGLMQGVFTHHCAQMDRYWDIV